MTHSVVVSCEHGGHKVPARFARMFAGRTRLLTSHRGWDPGALDLAHDLSDRLGAPLIAATVTRLLVDLNRSPDNPSLWSVISAPLSERERRAVIAACYQPYRRDAITHVRAAARSRPVIHLSMHSFTPVLRGRRRHLDVGVLFDPVRTLESRVAHSLIAALKSARPRWRIRANQPYKGTDDGLTTHIRTLLPDARYAGIEIEVNQRLVRLPSWPRSRSDIAAALSKAVRAHA